MKWFKHDSCALHDAKIEKLIMKHGIAGYGLYFACVEIIASNLTPQNITFELEHDSEVLAHKFQMDTLKVEEIMRYCVELGLFEMNSNNRILCTKLAKRLDIKMSSNQEVRQIVSSGNFKKLLEPNSSYKQIRLDKTRREETRREEKTEVAEYVHLTPSELKKLQGLFGPDWTKRLIDTLNAYKGAHGKRYKSDYMAIHSWVIDKVKPPSLASPAAKKICGGCGAEYVGTGCRCGWFEGDRDGK